MRNLVFMPVLLIKKAETDNWLRSLAYFTRLKSLYKNNTHYNFSLRSLSVKLKCSPACLSHHLKVLEEKQLIRYTGGNITFLGLRKLQSLYKLVNIGVPVDHKNQLDILRGQIIRFNLTAQAHRIKKSEIQIRKKGFIPLTRDEKTNSSYVGLSAYGIASLFCMSKASGSRIRKKLNILGQVRSKRVFSVFLRGVGIKDYTILKRNSDIPPFSFFRDGKIIIERRNKMEYIGNKGNVSRLQKTNTA